MANLTARQELFVKEYLKDMNATQAYLRAGYKVSESVAAVNANRMLRNAKVQDRIDKAIEKRSKRLEWTAEDIMRDLRLIAESENEATKDRLKAYELAGKHLKMFTDKVEHSGETTHNVKATHDLSKLSTQELKNLESILSKTSES